MGTILSESIKVVSGWIYFDIPIGFHLLPLNKQIISIRIPGEALGLKLVYSSYMFTTKFYPIEDFTPTLGLQSGSEQIHKIRIEKLRYAHINS